MTWLTAGETTISFEEILELAIAHTQKNGTIHIGTDSQLIANKYVFSTAICLIGGDLRPQNLYFISKSTMDSKRYSTLLQRITEEVEKSIHMGLKMLAYCPTIDIELHLDISGEEKNESTSKFSRMLLGYAKGNGFECKIKPDAFAASSVADRHTKLSKEK